MKRTVFISILLALTVSIYAQNAALAKKVLDKTAAVVGNKTGASANFSMSGKYGTASGTIAIKGRKFHARTGQAIVWFDGKTEWTYMKNTDEVNITTPTEAQQQAMNPYQFINIYKNGFNLGVKTIGSNYQVHLTAKDKKRSIQEMYILINKSTYKPLQVKMRQANGWTTINISQFKATNISDATFIFNAKNYPDAEIIDLR
jgi:outer membrane lipoprotein-sorting protein